MVKFAMGADWFGGVGKGRGGGSPGGTKFTDGEDWGAETKEGGREGGTEGGREGEVAGERDSLGMGMVPNGGPSF